jgi:H+/Cl- antiporter ClcA
MTFYYFNTNTIQKQGYAVAVGALSAVTSLVYFIPFIVRVPLLFIWDTILFIFWVAVFGVFGNMYIHADPQGDSGIRRMKNAVWIDLINMLLWLASAIGMLVYFIKAMGGRSRFTGRATV